MWCTHSIQLSDYFLSLPVKSQFVLTILCHADSFSYASHYRLYAMSWLFVQCSDLRIVLFFPNPRGVYPIAVYTGRLCLKEVPFSGYKVYKRAGISRVEVYESARKSTILVFKRTKRANRRIFGCEQFTKTCDLSIFTRRCICGVRLHFHKHFDQKSGLNIGNLYYII